MFKHLVAVAFILAIAAVGCTKKSETPPVPEAAAPQAAPAQPSAPATPSAEATPTAGTAGEGGAAAAPAQAPAGH